MWQLAWPIGLVVLSNVVYNISTKKTPSDVNAFLSLTVTYVIAAVCTAVLYFISSDKTGIIKDVSKLNWTSFVLGISIVGLEFGYILIYRNGWNINIAPIVCTIILTCVLIIVGYFLFKESLSLRQGIGIAVCLVGLILITYKR